MNNEVFVVSNGTHYLDWDDRGAMSTGYPVWGTLVGARQYTTIGQAEGAAEGAWRCDKEGTYFIRNVKLVLGNGARYIPVEQDPEYAEYQRLQAKFKNR